MRAASGIGHSDVADPRQDPSGRQESGIGQEGVERVDLAEAREPERDPRAR